MSDISRIHFDSQGLWTETGVNLSETMSWTKVKEIVAFKDDAFVYDIICIEFQSSDKSVLKIDEEYEGYRELLEYLPQVFAGIRTDWFSDVAFPAFEHCLTKLWVKNKID
ncbi:MAG: hypothetical protein O3A29_12500 [Planctomycetota bacterium]|nr:hypothetical protein [Planctomycetota bacterium]